MREAIVPTQTVLVGPQAFDIVRHLRGRYVLYLDVCGTAQEVLGFGPAANTLVVSGTATRAGHFDWGIEVLAHGFKNSEKLCIDGIEATATATGKLAT